MDEPNATQFLPPSLLRPALLGDVQAPGILLQTGRYGASFLVIGDAEDPHAIFLAGQYKFQTFKRGTNERWGGLAIESLEFELNFSSPLDLSEHSKRAGMIIRKDDQLTIAAIGEGPLSRVIEIPIKSGLPSGTLNQHLGFLEWRVLVHAGDRRVTVWESSTEVRGDSSN